MRISEQKGDGTFLKRRSGEGPGYAENDGATQLQSEAHMIVGKVVGSVVSTRKSEKLIGNKFMIVEPVHHMAAENGQIVAIDIIGAGIGEYVLVAQGSAARIGCGVDTAPVDAAIVGIIDDGAGLE